MEGIRRALTVIAGAPEISPPVVVEGLAISFVSAIMGLVFLLISALAWFLLRGMYVRRTTGVMA